MAIGVNSTKTPARPSHEAIESETNDVTEMNKSEAHKLDRLGMESAKRAQNRIHSYEENTAKESIISK